MNNLINELLECGVKNQTIRDNYIKAYKIINDDKYKNIACSISGGSDSDIMLDIIHRVDRENKVKYIWFDTGIEYQATKEHLVYLENKYGIEIDRCKPIKSIPQSVREYGEPFMSKFTSRALDRLQAHGFDFKDGTYEELLPKYNNGKCKSEIGWWTNHRDTKGYGYSMFNINYKKYLKEFILENPPKFKISNKCCQYAKKDVSKKYIKENDIDLMIVGVRKAEGGIRGGKYKNCYTTYDDKCDQYRPIFFYTNKDKEDYEKCFGIVHSRCYTEYGLKRTGCVGCPYNLKLLDELEVIQKYEPKLYKACTNIFKNSYEYTRKFYEFRERIKNGE